MPVFRVLYHPQHDPPAETVEADRVEVEAELRVVFRRTVFVMGQPRKVVVRRLPAHEVADVAELA